MIKIGTCSMCGRLLIPHIEKEEETVHVSCPEYSPDNKKGVHDSYTRKMRYYQGQLQTYHPYRDRWVEAEEWEATSVRLPKKEGC